MDARAREDRDVGEPAAPAAAAVAAAAREACCRSGLSVRVEMSVAVATTVPSSSCSCSLRSISGGGWLLWLAAEDGTVSRSEGGRRCGMATATTGRAPASSVATAKDPCWA